MNEWMNEWMNEYTDGGILFSISCVVVWGGCCFDCDWDDACWLFSKVT